MADVGAAIDELRARSGASEIGLVGLKLGATLAAVVAAERGDVASLVLWAPHTDGKSFVAEATRLHRMHKLLEPAGFAAGPAARREGEEALGFFLTRETIADLERIDLLSLERRPAPRVVVAGTGPSAAELALADHLASSSADLIVRHVPPPRFLLSVPHETRLPEDVLGPLVACVDALHPPSGGEARAAARPTRARAPERAVEPGELDEEPVVFGDRHPLFGILTRPPEGARSAARPAVLLLNAGTVHRIGPHRLYVPLARRWARLGFHVLRLDLSGVGDSPAPPGCEENLCYPRDAARDVSTALSLLGAASGARRFVLVGLCSGGDHAFRAALADERVGGVVILNPRTFGVRNDAVIQAHQHARYYEGSALRAASWRKVLRGEVDLARVARVMLPKLGELWRARGLELLRGGKGSAPTDVPRSLRQLAERGVDTFVLATDKDPGIDYVDTHFGDAMRALRAVPGFRRETVRGTDHTFTSLWAQRHVADLLTDHLARRHLGRSA
jgi:dienelactone hydrolase